jgi:hypothetical protein
MPEQMTKQDAIETLEIFRNDYTREDSAICRAINIAIDALRQHTIEPEVRHGRWENIPGMNNTVFCSECGAAADKYLAKRYKGCPFCLCVMSATGTNVGGKGGNG